MHSKNKVVLISYDAFSIDNWEKACRLPNLKWLIERGTFTNKLKSVYPTLTYVVHSTMVTGVYPNKHRIFHNSPFQPFVAENMQEWFWYKKALEVPTIYERVKEYGFKTASIMWPVTGGANITYNLPEVRALKGENQALKILTNGTPLFVLDMELKFGKRRESYKLPFLDNFSTDCCRKVIEKKKPKLTMIHLIALDDAKHNYGTKSKEVDEAMLIVDKNIGEIIEAVKNSGELENTTFIVVGDHGQKDVYYKVALNNLLKEKGLIHQEKGRTFWRAYIQTSGGSAYLYIKDGDYEAEKIALETLSEAKTKEIYGIEEILHMEDMKKLHSYDGANYAIEAKVGYSFLEEISEETIIDLKEKGQVYANHGYSPCKDDYTCNLIISGNKIKKGLEIQDVEMVDIAPTIANILDIDFPNCDGKALYEVLE